MMQPDICVEYHHSASSKKAALTLPLEALADCEGAGSSMVQFEPLENKSIAVRWERAGTPHQREYSQRESISDSFPAWPKRASANDSSLLEAMEQATQTAGDSSPRLALNSIQLRGTQGDIAATDGRQLLVQGGFRFPWKDAVLVPRSPIFAAKELNTKEAVHVAQSEAHVLFRTGNWTIALRIDTAARFPNIESVIPKQDPRATQWSIGEEEANSLAGHLPYLPAADEQFSPITVDLAKPVAVRACKEGEKSSTEVALPESRVTGKATRIAIDRRYLQRALKLGFRSFQISDPTKPILCQEAQRLYVWVPLDPKGALAPQPQGLRVGLPSPQTNGHKRAAAKPKVAVPAQTIRDVAADRSPRGFGRFLEGAYSLWRLVHKHHQDQAR